ncbi:heme exporter protein CcmB [Natronococcus jeotgali]|uniref:ABC-type transport system permease protein 1 (Heme exporter protein B) n=1 Tax=Natronococcus jeotgali DSM 18795 TaxID=1227498 RepID=L9XTT9_9EURY|nr:heme exporter protein CcmB [Natronococcus jeotgali]ELY64008.1 ABC-type transport system permease protein 1 (heme exporter protein B) [Natronococcus jeotgali DSM 18795]
MSDGIAGYGRVVLEVTRKDLLIELRSKHVLNTAVVFALLVVVIFAFSFARSFTDVGVVGSGALWIAFVFAGTFGVSQSAATEVEYAGLDGLLLVPVDRSAIYVGKVVSNTVFTTGVAFVTLCCTVVFLGFSVALETVPVLLVVFLLAAFGFTSTGVLIATITARARLRELLLPLLLVPLVVPVLLAGVELTRMLTEGHLSWQWFQLLLVYDGLLFLTGVATFEYVVEG